MSGDHDLQRDRLAFTAVAGTLGVASDSDSVNIVLSGVLAVCTKCKALKSIKEFGLRVMANGVIRSQARCMPCRNSTKP